MPKISSDDILCRSRRSKCRSSKPKRRSRSRRSKTKRRRSKTKSRSILKGPSRSIPINEYYVR